MADQKRFQAQNLNSEDYEKTESGAKVVKDGGIILLALAPLVFVGKKFGPSLLKNASKIFKA